jgi:adenylate cyclase
LRQSRKLIAGCAGCEIKTIGDAFLVAFRSTDRALDYAVALLNEPGASELQLRAGIHIGSVLPDEGDVFGRTVNFAARVVGVIKDAEIWLSVRRDLISMVLVPVASRSCIGSDTTIFV